MKFKICIIAIINLFLFSCRGEVDDVQKIDQILNFYIQDSTGKDLLNPKISGSYTSVSLQDLNADYDLVAISSFSLKKDTDTITYLQYLSGAKRILLDSVSPSQKTYQSAFRINLSRTINGSVETATDTIKLQYNWTPTLFEISKVFYKNQRIPIVKTETANILKVVK